MTPYDFSISLNMSLTLGSSKLMPLDSNAYLNLAINLKLLNRNYQTTSNTTDSQIQVSILK